MSSPAQSRGLRKATRDAFQAGLAVVAAGGATALIEVVIGSVNNLMVAAVLTLVFKVLIAYAQNYLETRGSIPAMLPTPGLITESVGGVVGKVVGTVDAVTGTQLTTTVGDATSATTQVVGTVLDTAGKTVGGVAGTVGGLLGKKAG
jgi:hypothetical protein